MTQTDFRAHAEFDQMFCQHYPILLNWCRSRVPAMLGDPEDILHDIYLRCRRSWCGERRSKIRPLTFLLRALRWQILDKIRADVRRRRNETREHDRRPLVEAGEHSSYPVLREALASLTHHQRHICYEFMKGRSDHEVCREMDISRGALHVHLCRTKKSLRMFFQS